MLILNGIERLIGNTDRFEDMKELILNGIESLRNH